jgi:hypothetical protein
MTESLYRVVAIARNTLTEALRQKVLSLLFLFGIVLIGLSVYFSDLTFNEQFKFLKDFGFGVTTVIGTLMALMGAAQLLPLEVESRTIYTILSKPVRRGEFLLGKYLGLLCLLFVAISLMSLVFTGVLLWKEKQLVAAEMAAADSSPGELVAQNVAMILQESRDPRLIQGLILIFAKVAVIAALGVLISTFATSQMFTVATGLLLVIIGHMQSVARTAWIEEAATANLGQKLLLGLVSFLVPDFNAYGIIDDIVAGSAVPWSHTLELTAYSIIYIAVIMVVSQLIFAEKEL